MSFVEDFVGDVVGEITGTKQAGEAAKQAGQLQYQASMAGVEEQRRQFDKLVELMAPYVAAGEGAIGGLQPYRDVGPEALAQQRALAGLGGPGAQQAAIAAIESSPQFQSIVRQGENALLQQASATGGLRGGNTQAALAQFRPDVLSKLIESQYAKLGGLTDIGLATTSNVAKLGQASAAGQAAVGMETASSIGNLLQKGGAAQAGAAIAAGSVPRQTFGDILKIGGTIAGFF